MRWREAAMYGFLLTGGGAAAYLTYTHYAGVEPQCYGIGDCAYVQASSYATVLGVPVALLGLLAYLIIFALLVASRRLPRTDHAVLATQLGFGVAFAGTLYSAYLTAIEAFVLRAYCIYCIISAISITALCLLLGMEVSNPSAHEEERHAAG